MSKMSARERLTFLGSNYYAKITPRRLSSFIHERRTGDKDAAMHMLALKPGGAKVDIAPTWLLLESGLYFQHEHKSRERARGQRGADDGPTQRHSNQESKGQKGKGKVKGRGKGGDAGSSLAQPPKKD